MKGRALRLTAAAGLVGALLAGAVAAPAAAQDAFAVTPATWALADGAPAVVRMSETTFRVDGPGRATTRVTHVATALSPAGRDVGALRVAFGGFRRLARLDGVLRDGRGRELRRVGRRDVRETALGSIYEDLRLAEAELYGEAPFTVEWTYEIEHVGVLGWPTWRPQAGGLPVEAASFRLNVPAGTAVRWRLRDLPEPTVRRGERDRYAWAVAARPPVQIEPFGPPAHAQVPELRLGTDRFEIGGAAGRLDSWEAFGAWYGGLAAGRQALPDAARAEVRRLVAGSPSDRESARRLYRYLQETTRYVSIQLGLGGWQPFDAETVWERRLGDCKALTNYLQALLAAAGIASEPVLIYADDDGSDLDPDFPDNAFNHVVLRLPMRTDALDAGGDAVWLECTSSHAAFGHLGAFTEGRAALRVTADGGELVQTPTSPPSTNRTVRSARFRLGAGGSAEGRAAWALHGEPRAASLAWLAGADGAGRLAWLQDATGLPSLDLGAFELGDASQDTLRITAELALPLAARRAGSRLLVGLVPLAPPPPALPEQPGRRQPLRLGAARTSRDSVRFELPPGASVVRLPEPVALESAVGRYALRATDAGGAVVVVRELTVSAPRQPADGYAAARTFFEAVAAADAGLAVVRLGR